MSPPPGLVGRTDRMRGGLKVQLERLLPMHPCVYSTPLFFFLYIRSEKKNQYSPLINPRLKDQADGFALCVSRRYYFPFRFSRQKPTVLQQTTLLSAPAQPSPSGGKSADCGATGGRNNGAGEGRAPGRDSRADGGPLAAAPRAGRPLRGRPPGPCRAAPRHCPSSPRTDRGWDRISGLGVRWASVRVLFSDDRFVLRTDE